MRNSILWALALCLVMGCGDVAAPIDPAATKSELQALDNKVDQGFKALAAPITDLVKAQNTRTSNDAVVQAALVGLAKGEVALQALVDERCKPPVPPTAPASLAPVPSMPSGLKQFAEDLKTIKEIGETWEEIRGGGALRGSSVNAMSCLEEILRLKYVPAGYDLSITQKVPDSPVGILWQTVEHLGYRVRLYRRNQHIWAVATPLPGCH